MLRKITGFSTDENGDWVANLECFHGQHVRHNPPFVRRQWVVSKEGRKSRLGHALDCLKCNRMEWPDHLVITKRTTEINEKSIPEYFMNDYVLETGTWGKIVVLQGELGYKVNVPFKLSSQIMTGEYGIIVPDTKCFIIPFGDVRFFIEFYTRQ